MSDTFHRAPVALREVMERVSEAVIYVPVQRQNAHGGQMTPDVVAAMPVPLWEELAQAFDDFDTGWQKE